MGFSVGFIVGDGIAKAVLGLVVELVVVVFAALLEECAGVFVFAGCGWGHEIGHELFARALYSGGK